MKHSKSKSLRAHHESHRKHHPSHSSTRPNNTNNSNCHHTSCSTYCRHPTYSACYKQASSSTGKLHHNHQKLPHTNTTSYPTTHSTSTRPPGYPKPQGLGRGFPVVSRRFLHSNPSVYAIHLSRHAKSPVYHIRNVYQRTVFHIDHRHLCLHDVYTLYTHPSNRPWLCVRGFFLSARSAMAITDIDGRPILILQKMSVISMKKRTMHGYTAKVAGRPDLVITSDHGARSFSFRDRRSNEVAHAKRRRRHDSGDDYSSKSYKMYISPGYDNALFVMCMVCIIHTWNP